MSKIISIALQKGGVGKTTTAVNLATCLALFGKKVLLIDSDPQGNASICLGVEPDNLSKSIFTVLLGETQIQDAIVKTKWGLDLLPANDDLSEMDLIVIKHPEVFERPMHVLKEAIAPIVNDYEYILIDLPPSKGLLTINALTASTDVLIPLQCEFLATSGVNKIIKTINDTQDNYNPELNILGVIPTMYNQRTNLSSNVLQEARKFFGNNNIRVYETTIYKSIKFGEAPAFGEPAVVYFKDNEHIQAYFDLTREVFGVGK